MRPLLLARLDLMALKRDRLIQERNDSARMIGQDVDEQKAAFLPILVDSGHGLLRAFRKEGRMAEKDEEDAGEGTNIPGALGAVVAVTKSEPVKALLGPAMTVFGQYYGERAEEIVARWRQKRQKNLDHHRERVIEVEGPPPSGDPSEQQTVLAAEWVERAQAIDPEDKELAAVWEALLGKIYHKLGDAEEMITAVRKLDPQDAQLLFHVEGKWRRRIPDYANRYEKLVSIGLIERNQGAQIVSVGSLVFILFLYFLVQSFNSILFKVLVGIGLAELADYVLLPVLVLLAILLYYFRFIKQIGKFRLTEFGKRVQTSARPYIGH